MSIEEGKALILKLKHANGDLSKRRPFLVVYNDENAVILLNVSTLKGREEKVMFDSNQLIDEYNPPLDEPSYVQLDEVYIIKKFPGLKNAVTDKSLKQEELSNIKYKFKEYNEFEKVVFEPKEVKKLNSYC